MSCSGELWNETSWCEILLPSWCSCHHESLDAMQRSNQKSWCCSETLLSLETCYNTDWSLHECINSDGSCDDLHLNLILKNKIIRWFASVSFSFCRLFCCFIPMQRFLSFASMRHVSNKDMAIKIILPSCSMPAVRRRRQPILPFRFPHRVGHRTSINGFLRLSSNIALCVYVCGA